MYFGEFADDSYLLDPGIIYIVANKAGTFPCFTLEANEFKAFLILTTELQIFHHSHPLSTKDAHDSADPNNMQDAAHLRT